MMFTSKHHMILFIAIIAAVVVGGIFLLYSRTTEAPTQALPSEDTDYEPIQVTFEGTYVCLPHTDTEGPQTAECALGLKLGDGTYFALDFGMMSQEVPALKEGDRFRATGLMTPIQRLSSNKWQNYPIVGIFSVTDSFKRL